MQSGSKISGNESTYVKLTTCGDYKRNNAKTIQCKSIILINKKKDE